MDMSKLVKKPAPNFKATQVKVANANMVASAARKSSRPAKEKNPKMNRAKL